MPSSQTHSATGSKVIEFVRVQTNEDAIADLFAKGLEVHLRNPDELIGYAHLFPSGGIGVAQGSSLSAFAGNVLLFELDHQLNAMGVCAIRYIDDILMVAPDETTLNAAVKHAEDSLIDLASYAIIALALYREDNDIKQAMVFTEDLRKN